MKHFLFFLSLLFLTFTLFAQQATENFSLSMPAAKVSNSLYNSLKLVDVRNNPQNMGMVQLGAFNRKARVVPEAPFDQQLSRAMEAIIDSTAQAGELFLLLRQLSFAEITGALYCTVVFIHVRTSTCF